MYTQVDSTISSCHDAVALAKEHLSAKSARDVEDVMKVVVAKISARRDSNLDNHGVWVYYQLTPSEEQDFDEANTAQIVSDVTKYWKQRGTTVPDGRIESELQTFITRSDEEKKMSHEAVTHTHTHLGSKDSSPT